MVCGEKHVKLLPVTINSSVEKVLDMVPGLVEKVNEMLCPRPPKKKEKKEEHTKQKEDEEEE
jgi:uncharacterized spore protein YtfJ